MLSLGVSYLEAWGGAPLGNQVAANLTGYMDGQGPWGSVGWSLWSGECCVALDRPKGGMGVHRGYPCWPWGEGPGLLLTHHPQGSDHGKWRGLTL